MHLLADVLGFFLGRSQGSLFLSSLVTALIWAVVFDCPRLSKGTGIPFDLYGFFFSLDLVDMGKLDGRLGCAGGWQQLEVHA